MSDFKFNEKETYTLDEVKEISQQGIRFGQKQSEATIKSLNDSIALTQGLDIIKEAPETNRGIIQDLVKTGKTAQQVKESYPHLFATAEPTKKIVDVAGILEGTAKPTVDDTTAKQTQLSELLKKKDRTPGDEVRIVRLKSELQGDKK